MGSFLSQIRNKNAKFDKEDEHLQKIFIVKLYENDFDKERIDTTEEGMSCSAFAIDPSKKTAIQETEKCNAPHSEIIVEWLHDGKDIGGYRDEDEILQSVAERNVET